MKQHVRLILSLALTTTITACGGGGGGGGGSNVTPGLSDTPTSSTAATSTSSTPTSSTSSAQISSASSSLISTSSVSSSLTSSSLTSSSSSLSSSTSSSSISSSSTSSSSVALAGPAGTLWHNNYALDYREGVQLAYLDGRLPKQITARDDVNVSVWPDGKQYVVTNWNVYDDYTDITAVDLASGNTLYQAQVDGYLRNVWPSPANKSLIKVRQGKDSISPFEEYILDLSTMKSRYTISDRDWFAWMPDGRFMLINIDTGNMRIASLDSTEETVIGHLDVPADRFMGEFTVSPTGKQILMVMNRRGGTSTDPDLWIGNIDGTEFQQLTDTKIIAGAAWSPDGRYVAYTTDTGSVCSYGGCMGSCDQWYTPVDLRKVEGLPNTPGSEVFKVTDRSGMEQTLGCALIAWTP